MRRSATFFALLAVFAGLALAESWQGRLIDATCYEQNKSAATCDPTSSTTQFVLLVSTTPYSFDSAGNSKAAEAFKNRADRASDPTKPLPTMIMAKITGTKDGGNTLKVETVELQ